MEFDYQLNSKLQIKNKLYQSSLDCSLVNILFTISTIQKDRQTYILKPFKITLIEYKILKFLATNKRESMVELNRVKNPFFKVNISRIIDSLYNGNYVSRETSKDDRRMVNVMILPKGINLLNEISGYETHLNNKYNKMIERVSNEGLGFHSNLNDQSFTIEDGQKLIVLLEKYLTSL